MSLPAGLQRPDGGTRVAPFGVRFVDDATGRNVRDGLSVTLFPRQRPERRCETLLSAGGVYALLRAPGLGDFDRGDGAREFWAAALADPVDFTVEVRDTLGRFHEVSFGTTLPTPGPFGSGSEPRGAPPRVVLPGLAARPVPPAAAVVRADLCDARAPERPLRHALLRVVYGGTEIGRGLADAQGRVAVMFAHPEPAQARPFHWPITLHLHCTRPLTGFADPAAASPLPDLAALQAQDAGTEWQLLSEWDAALASGTTLPPPTLELGRELVLKTAGRPTLLATPA